MRMLVAGTVLLVSLSGAAQTPAAPAPPAAGPDTKLLADPNAPERKTAVVAVAERIGPAVVNVHADEVVQTRVRSGDDFDSFLRDFMEPRYQEEFATTSLGSGVLIDPRHVVTNHHVVEKAARVRIRMSDRREFACTVVGTDPDLDLAVLRVQTEEDLPYVDLANSRDVMVGETVVAIGNPFGLQHTVTSGVVSALHRSVRAPGRTYHDFLQTDASINPGNSGGPLLDIQGRLVGINTAIYGNAQGIGFAIPVNRARNIAHEIIAAGKIRPLYLGLEVKHVTRKIAEEKKLSRPEGVLVTTVDPGGPAAQAGVQVGDVVVEVEDFPILMEFDYTAKLRDFAPGNQVPIEVRRGGDTMPLVLEAGTAPAGFARRVLQQQLGLEVVKLDEKTSDALGVGMDQGKWVIKNVREGSYGEKAELKAGDALWMINEIDAADEETLDQGVFKARRNGRMYLAIRRQSRGFRVVFEM